MISPDRPTLDTLLLWLDHYGVAVNELLAAADQELLNRRLHAGLPTLAEVAAHLVVTESLYVRHVLGDEHLPASAPAHIETTWDLQSPPVTVNGRTLLDSAGRCPGAQMLIEAHLESHGDLRGRLAGAADVHLNHQYFGPYNRSDTLAGILAYLIAHEGYHLSELRVITTLAST